MKNLIYSIKIEAEILNKKTDEELTTIIETTKNRLKKEKLEDILPIWFAVTQEISERKIGLRHFDTQLLAGILLHEGNIVEMKTGEGKTLAASLPVGLNALLKKGVHVITVNEYLAERDQKLMGKIYTGLGLTVGLIKNKNNNKEKQKNYNFDITYVTNSEVVFDFLRDSSAVYSKDIVQRPFSYCIIDEIDSILIDEARTPLILSSPQIAGNINKLYFAKQIANNLEKQNDFQLDEKRKDVYLTEIGYKKVIEKVGKKTLYDPADPWMLEILNALKAKYLFKLNKDYIILNNKIVIVDEFTGRIMEDRRWSMGIHEAIEIKENVKIGNSTKTKTSITYQNFFTLYPKLAGMTGTAKTTEKEFKDIYNLNVVVVPTAKPMVRKDLSDLVYQTELTKWKAVLEETKKAYSKGQPILIGTATVEKSEFLSELFKLSNIPHQVLNAKPENVKRENEIIAQAGRQFAVTIATNMAGRGTDIILGGNPAFQTKQKLLEIIENKTNINEKISNLLANLKNDYSDDVKKLIKDAENLPYSLETSKFSLQELYKFLYEEIYENWKNENQKVKNSGGLFILGTERHETRRIDNQLRGRSGRQGDPGISQFFVSLEDELIKIFGGDSIKKWVEYLIDDKDTPLESKFLTNSLENAQKKIELFNYDLRKNIFQYDEILNNQRKQLFKARREILTKNIYSDLFLRASEELLDEEKTKNFEKKEKLFGSYSTYNLKKRKNIDKKKLYSEIWITNDLKFSLSNFYELSFLKNKKSVILLTIIDFFWTEHIERTSYIRETINWRSYGQQNPLMEYNIQAFLSYRIMFEQIRSSMIYYFLNSPINY